MISLTGTVNAWKALPRFIKIVGYVGVVCGTVASAATAYPIMEPYWLAHRGYVRNYDTGQYAPILKRIITVQLVQDRERRLKTSQSRFANRAVQDRWTGASGTERLSFRWAQAKAHLRDLANAQ